MNNQNMYFSLESMPRILVVDDEAVNLKLLGVHLRRKQYEVLEADNGHRALELAKDQAAPPDLILLDVMMPDMDGLETCRRLKADPRTRDTPVIFLSAVHETEIKAKGLEMGGVDYVSKPFDARELLARVHTHLTMRMQERKIREYAGNLEEMVRERTLRLTESEQKYRAIFENTGTAMAIMESDTSISLVNSEFELLTGYTRDCIQGKMACKEFLLPESRKIIEAYVATLFASGNQKPVTGEMQVLTESGESRNVVLIMAQIPGAPRCVVSLLDVTDQKRAEAQVLHHAYHDSLTGLSNRSCLLEELRAKLDGMSKGNNGQFALLLLDLDRFNMVNESLGHNIGDELIKAVSLRLAGTLKPGDLLARLGGDEFAILFNDAVELSVVTDYAAKVLRTLNQSFELVGQNLITTSSIGIALSSMGYERAEDLLRDADAALHRAKLQGKARYVIFDAEMHLRAKKLLQLVTDMRLALQHDEFILYYQPIISLKTGRIAGFEALIRWQHPTQGFLPPGRFLPEAEEVGLIIPIDYWVLRTACATMAKLLQGQEFDENLIVSVNLSGKQFDQEDIYEHVRVVLQETGLRPQCLKLEITEGAVMENAEIATKILQQLNSLGIKISIDDFGTGYSSLSYLHRFPVDMLKIDRSFVSQMAEGDENLEIVRTIVALAHNMGLEVIAEGVETEEQQNTLKRLGCEYVQGFYYSKPVDMDTLVEEWLQK